MKIKIEEAYQTYLEACFGGRTIPRNQDTELRRAFFGGAGWLKGSLLKIVDDEEKAMDFLSDIAAEFDDYIADVKATIN